MLHTLHHYTCCIFWKKSTVAPMWMLKQHTKDIWDVFLASFPCNHNSELIWQIGCTYILLSHTSLVPHVTRACSYFLSAVVAIVFSSPHICRRITKPLRLEWIVVAMTPLLWEKNTWIPSHGIWLVHWQVVAICCRRFRVLSALKGAGLFFFSFLSAFELNHS